MFLYKNCSCHLCTAINLLAHIFEMKQQIFCKIVQIDSHKKVMQFINTWFIYILNLIQINQFFINRFETSVTELGTSVLLFLWLLIFFTNNHFHRTRQRSLVFNYAGIQTYLIAMRQCFIYKNPQVHHNTLIILQTVSLG